MPLSDLEAPLLGLATPLSGLMALFSGLSGPLHVLRYSLFSGFDSPLKLERSYSAPFRYCIAPFRSHCTLSGLTVPLLCVVAVLFDFTAPLSGQTTPLLDPAAPL